MNVASECVDGDVTMERRSRSGRHRATAEQPWDQRRVSTTPLLRIGSCLSYGHSCWGAHGKRSDIQGIPVRLVTKPNGLNGIAPILKQWIMPNLKTGRFIGGFPKEPYVLSKWDTAPMIDEDIESIRTQINNKNKDNERTISNDNTQRNMNEKLESNQETFLISSDEYDKLINNPQKFDILKYLNEENGNMK